MSGLLKIAFSPPAEPSELDTGLRFTDILFGFVIRELFLRLQHWSDLPGYVRWQLVTATVLVIGSWIGFRRSLNRPRYELKFFNFPLLRFGLDQLMVILYFRIATLSPNLDDKTATLPAPATLARHTAWILLLIFGLYVAWDFGGIWMGLASKYPNSHPDPVGLAISVVSLALVFMLWRLADSGDLSPAGAEKVFAGATIALLLYRFLKDIRTSLRPASVALTLERRIDAVAMRIDALDKKFADLLNVLDKPSS